jgi:molybdate transport system substrate-binding protein
MTELKLYCTIATQPVVEMPAGRHHGLGPGAVQQQHVAVLARLQALIDGSQTPIASSATAIAVKAGAKRPDISSVEALKRALREAMAISYSHPDAGGASGIYVAKLLQQWGMEREISAKTRFPPPAGLTAQFLITGEADFAIQQKSELLQVPGIEIVGFLPGELHMVTHFVAGIEKHSPHAALAKAFIDALRTPEARAAFTAKGLDPA